MTQCRAIARRWRAFAALLALLAAVVAAVTAAPAVELRPGERALVTGTEIVYLAESEGPVDLTQALAAYDAGDTRQVETEVPDFGAVFDTFWLFVPVENAGAVAGAWHVATRAPFFPQVSIQLRHADGTLDKVLDNTVDDPFDARPVRHRTIVSGPFTLQPGERGQLVIRFEAGGVSNFAFTLESEKSLRTLFVEDAAISGVFYAFSIAAILFFAVFSYAVRAWTGLMYAGMFSIGVLLNAQMDGLTFQFLWPGWPGWNGIAALVLLNLLCGVGFYVAARQREMDGPRPRFRRVAYGLALFSLAVNALIPVIGPGAVVMVGYALFVAMFAAQAAAILPALRMSAAGLGAVSLVGVVLVAVVCATAVILMVYGVALPPLIGYNLHRIFYLVMSLATMATLVGVVVQLRRDHEGALEREVVAARRDADLNRDLFEAEKNYTRARDLAARRQRQLATASHDIKQPLASLRLSLDALVAGDNPETKGRLRDAFDYLEGLTGTYLAEARPDADGDSEEAEAADVPARVAAREASEEPAEEAPEEAPEDAVEPYPLSLVTGTVDQMFREEAVSKGLKFACTGDEHQIAVPILPLLRLVSNLTSNAVKYTVEGSVAVTAGTADGAAFIAVEDTGPGMSAEALARYRQAGQKGETSKGEGLGMAIADDITARLGLTLEVDSAPGEGTRFRIVIGSPQAAGP